MDLVAKQWDREANALREAEGKCRQALQRDEKGLQFVDRRAGRDFLQRTIQPLAGAIEREQQAILENKAKLPAHGLPILSLPAMTLALLALRTVFNRVAGRDFSEPPSYPDLAIAIGKRCFWERKRRSATPVRTGSADPDLPDLRKLLAHKRMGETISRFEDLDARPKDWALLDQAPEEHTAQNWVALGGVLLDLADEHDVIDIEPDDHRGRKMRRIYLAEKLAGRVERFTQDPTLGLAIIPAHRPMIVRPRPWQDLEGGGYLTAAEPDTQEPATRQLVKHRDHPKQTAALEAAAARGQLKTVYAAINALQETPWRLNRRVYAVMCHAWEHDLALPGLPDRERLAALAAALDPILDQRKALARRQRQLKRRRNQAEKKFQLKNHGGPHPNCSACAERAAIEAAQLTLDVEWQDYHKSKGPLEPLARQLDRQDAELRQRRKEAEQKFHLKTHQKTHGDPYPGCSACDERIILEAMETALAAANADFHQQRSVFAGDDAKSFKERLRERAKLTSQQMKLKRLLEECGLLEQEAHEVGKQLNELTLYVPWQIDTRGRAYPMVSSLSPQGNDYARALLEFADGKPLDERGRFWLAIHVANTYGMDKLSFADRVAWTTTHTAQIGELAGLASEDGVADPDRIQHLAPGIRSLWEGADEKKRWQFLAACFEWAQSTAPGFVSHLPVVLDASASGLQHLSALGRDKDGAEATNLLLAAEDQPPQDLYQRVADLLEPVVAQAAEADGDNRKYAAVWQGHINRRVVKRGVMTTPYGVTDSGRRKQIHDLMQDEDWFATVHDPWGAAKYLSAEIGSCINEVVGQASGIMKWLQSVAIALAHAGRGIEWTTPAGLPVVVWNYRLSELTVRVKWTEIGSGTPREFEFRASTPGSDPGLLGVDDDEQEDTIAPNFVHSLDAAHMMLTIGSLRAKCLRHFTAIHDCFGVHASDVEWMRQVLQEEFVEMHQQPLLDQFIDEQITRAEKLPDPDLVKKLQSLKQELPQKMGQLDIKHVLESQYMFS